MSSQVFSCWKNSRPRLAPPRCDSDKTVVRRSAPAAADAAARPWLAVASTEATSLRLGQQQKICRRADFLSSVTRWESNQRPTP